MNNILRMFSNRKLMLLIVMAALSACTADAPSHQTQAPEAGVIELAKQSRIRKGAGIKITYSTSNDVLVGNEISVATQLKTAAHQSVSIVLIDNPLLQVMTDSVFTVQASEQGLIDFDWVFIPLQAGKTYLKFNAVVKREGREIPQVFSIPVYVGDESGNVPNHKVIETKPIVMPASRI